MLLGNHHTEKLVMFFQCQLKLQYVTSVSASMRLKINQLLCSISCPSRPSSCSATFCCPRPLSAEVVVVMKLQKIKSCKTHQPSRNHRNSLGRRVNLHSQTFKALPDCSVTLTSQETLIAHLQIKISYEVYFYLKV